jgi:uncharacterized membrane protein YgcG
MRISILAISSLAAAVTAGCTGALDEVATDEQEITQTEPGIPTRSGPNYFLTGADRDAVLVNCTLDFVLRGGNSVYTIALHGEPSQIQALPAVGVVGASGAQTVVVASCNGGTAAPGDESIAQYVARTEGIPCNRVIGCTGLVYPVCGPNRTTAMPDGSTTPGTPELYCAGVWVNGCVPPTAVTPNIPGVSMTTPMNTTPSAPANPGAVTVGCFVGDLPSDVWRRCRNVYNNYVPPCGGTCSDVWNELPSHPRKQTCDALVRSCIQNTLAACAAMAPPPPPAAPPPGGQQVAVGDGSNGSNGSGFNGGNGSNSGGNGSGDQLVYGGPDGSNGSNYATP